MPRGQNPVVGAAERWEALSANVEVNLLASEGGPSLSREHSALKDQ